MRFRTSLALLVPALALLGGGALLLPRPASAGCGCDHPPAGFAPVMPAFGSPGKDLRLNLPSGMELVPGAPYLVKIGGEETLVAAQNTTHLMAAVPADADVGPSEVEIKGPHWDHKFDKRDFTVMAAAPMVPERDGVFRVRNFRASISEDGTLLIPFNLTEIGASTQFLVVLGGLPLSFDHDDVVFHNADGVDLTLFTLAVDDPTLRQWGSYYGWEVEQDRGFKRKVYKNKVMKWLEASFSDQLTYWRHEFHTYKKAHLPGGTHEVDASGYHMGDGTLHIDHDHLVLSIAGKLRDNPKPREEWAVPSPGYEEVDVYVATVQSEGPIEPHQMMGPLLGALGSGSFESLDVESVGAYED